MSTGEFPEQMQSAKVIVLHEGSNINVLINYKRISEFPVFANNFETS